MRSYSLQHGPIHAVIYPKQGTGVMLVPGAELCKKDLSHHWGDMFESLAEWGLTPESPIQRDGSVVEVEHAVGEVECVRLVRVGAQLRLVGS